jgi:hypothetical protein
MAIELILGWALDLVLLRCPFVVNNKTTGCFVIRINGRERERRIKGEGLCHTPVGL